jgi:ABC-type transport system involved in multi-copper enzyme maturation permease subunit
VTRAGIATVAQQEFTIRIRAGRWRWLLLSWFGVLMLFTLLMRASIARVADADATDKGVVVYGGLTLLVLALALLVVPALAAQSVNGDRERGTLATLQVTRLTAADIAFGKLCAAWGTALVFLACSLPMVLYAMTLGGVPFWRVVVVTAVVSLLLGTVIALSLCLSALLSRTTTSGVLAYLLVFGLCVGTLISFGLAAALAQDTVTRTEPAYCRDAEGTYLPAPTASPVPGLAPGGPTRECQPATTYQVGTTRTDRVWWLLAPNPFVILADSAPQLPPLTAEERREKQQREARGDYRSDLRDADPLGAIGTEVRKLRLHPNERDGYTYNQLASDSSQPSRRRPVWPYGLAFDVLLGAGAVWLTTRKLTTPTRELPQGQRVA